MKKNHIDASRIQLCINDAMDGAIELRRGLNDVSIGDRHFASVRIYIDNKYYIKGVAIYADDLPDGVDIRYNIRSSKSLSKVFRCDKGYWHTKHKGIEVKKEEKGAWAEWSRSLERSMNESSNASINKGENK